MTLANDMRAAATTLEAVNDRFNYGDRVPWTAFGLRTEAEHVEAEEQEHSARVEQLAFELQAAFTLGPDCTEIARKSTLIAADFLIESGWRKGEPA